MDLNSTVHLKHGGKMPYLGLGTWQASPDECKNAVIEALKAGYRHIDTASAYGNEEAVGKGIKESGIPRKEIFLTTKLWNAEHENPEKALNESLKRLNTDYVDLYLIHWPVPERNDSWKVLEKLHKEGKAKAIGVSNFTIRHLQQLIDGCKTFPAVNQVEHSPFLYQKELHDFCQLRGIQLEAYSPLTRGQRLDNPVLLEVANHYNKSPAQIMIRWSLQHKIVTIPKSTTKERIIENADVFDFEISKDDMKKLDSLNENLRFCWNPEEMA